ncbi:MAG: tyrosine--tRNA ligase [Candidatus Hepatoplasma scabrum]|nr:MAG: tyrosine--tRNA ligase [Candidatus Hepatoplasma sp.]
MNKLLEDLKWRSLLKELITEDDVSKIFSLDDKKFYLGIDPTADSLHIGHFLTINLANLISKKSNLTPVFVLGGFTAQIGDPSGKNAERKLISENIVANNCKKIKEQLQFICKNLEIKNYEIFDNFNIYKNLTLIDFFKKYGKLINISKMLSRDVVKNRIDVGISYTEFSYQIFQAIDFLYLFENKNVLLQIGGSDQFGNILSGIEIIRRIRNKNILIGGITVPLLIDESGNKIGKTDGNPLWISKEKLSPYFIYQYLFNLSDSFAKKLLLQLTTITKFEFSDLLKKANSNKRERYLQKELIRRLFISFYGDNDYFEKFDKISEYLFTQNYQKIEEKLLLDIFKNLDSFKYDFKQDLFTQLKSNNLISSKREFIQFLKDKALKINNTSILEVDFKLKKTDFSKQKFLILSLGKKKKIIIKLN